MRLIVMTGASGEVESVAVVADEVAGQIGVESDGGGVVHRLEVEHQTVNEKSLRGALGEDARAAAHKTLLERLREGSPLVDQEHGVDAGRLLDPHGHGPAVRGRA